MMRLDRIGGSPRPARVRRYRGAAAHTFRRPRDAWRPASAGQQPRHELAERQCTGSEGSGAIDRDAPIGITLGDPVNIYCVSSHGLARPAAPIMSGGASQNRGLDQALGLPSAVLSAVPPGRSRSTGW